MGSAVWGGKGVGVNGEDISFHAYQISVGYSSGMLCSFLAVSTSSWTDVEPWYFEEPEATLPQSGRQLEEVGSTRKARSTLASRALSRLRPRAAEHATLVGIDTCRYLPPRYLLTADHLRAAAANRTTVFVTFADANVASFALNWARLLQQLGLRALVGVNGPLAASTEQAFVSADASLFCADGAQMGANGQAGRWAEVVPVVRLANKLQLSVLLSDADIAWMRDPLPYFEAVRRAHPRIDLLMMTDTAHTRYTTGRLGVQPAEGGASGRGFALELEPGYESAISYNIGVIWFCAHALPALEAMLGRFVTAVSSERYAAGGRPTGRRLAGGKSSASGSRGGRLASWDQEPINKEVLQVGLRRDPTDPRLVRVDNGRLAMGVLPMLQFTTSFTYHMFRRRRESVGAAPPYCLHAIFAHGKDRDRKISIFREEGLWVDTPDYYGEGDAAQRFLAVDTWISPVLRAHGGYEMIAQQISQVHQAFRLAALLNRTLVLPRLRCGERPLAYPCYAWYHRAMAYFGLNHDKVPMPDHCPMYYWLDLGKLATAPVRTREPSFLDNPRTPASVSQDVAYVRLCASKHSAGSACEVERQLSQTEPRWDGGREGERRLGEAGASQEQRLRGRGPGGAGGRAVERELAERGPRGQVKSSQVKSSQGGPRGLVKASRQPTSRPSLSVRQYMPEAAPEPTSLSC